MTIKVGDRLPAATLMEFHEVEKDGCSIGPNAVKVEDLTRGKKVVVFGLPGAFTPTCSAKHVPSYLHNYDKLKHKGVDTVDQLCGQLFQVFLPPERFVFRDHLFLLVFADVFQDVPAHVAHGDLGLFQLLVDLLDQLPARSARRAAR